MLEACNSWLVAFMLGCVSVDAEEVSLLVCGTEVKPSMGYLVVFVSDDGGGGGRRLILSASNTFLAMVSVTSAGEEG